MSFASLKVADLRQIAASYGAEDTQLMAKKALLTWLEEEGVTYSAHETLANADAADTDDLGLVAPTAPSKNEDLVLLKMERDNPGYDAIGRYFFTKEHPFQAVPREDANEIFRLENGFRLATDDEVRDFYN
jgi:hypothetical protein